MGMGLFDAFLAITVAPLVLTASFLNLISPQRQPTQIKKKNRLGSAAHGRLVLIAVDETSVNAVDYATREFLAPDDFVHLLHIIEFDEQNENNVKPFRFTSQDSPNIHQIKGLYDILQILVQSGVSFDGRVESPSGAESMANVILRINKEVDPDLLIVGASERTGWYSLEILLL